MKAIHLVTWLAISVFAVGCAHAPLPVAQPQSAPAQLPKPAVQRGFADSYSREKHEMEVAISSGSAKQVDEFIRANPASVWIPTATYHRDSLAFEEAKARRTRRALLDYIEKYPTSGWRPQAEYLINYGNLK